MYGKIYFALPYLQQGQLKVKLIIKLQGAQFCEARLAERDLATLIPRSLLLGSKLKAPPSLLQIIKALLKRLTVGRLVYLKNSSPQPEVLFLSWRKVKFVREAPRSSSTVQGEYHRPQPH